MLDSLITSKTRIKLLMKFFLNPDNRAYLRSLEGEFQESSNGIRVELNRLVEADMLRTAHSGNKKYYFVNTEHPLYDNVNNILRKQLGLDVIVDKVVEGLGGLEMVYLTGRLAQGLHSDVMDLLFIGAINRKFLDAIIAKLETLLHKKIRYLIYGLDEDFLTELHDKPHLLLWKKDQ